MYVFYCGGFASNWMRSGWPPASPVITAGLARPPQQKQEAVRGTGHDPSHSAPWVKQGPPQRNTGKFRSHQQGVEGYSGGRRGLRSSSLHAHLYACVCVCGEGERCTSVEQKPCNIITQKARRGTPKHNCSCIQYTAAFTGGNYCRSCYCTNTEH